MVVSEANKEGQNSSATKNEIQRDICAKARVLYRDAPNFVKALGLQRAAPGRYLALSGLITAFLESCGEDPNSELGRRLCTSAERALTGALHEQFGKDLPRVHLPRGSCPLTEQRGSTGFGVESEAFPSRLVHLEARDAAAVRTARRERRAQECDLASRPAAERGSAVTPTSAAVEADSSGGSSRYLSELLTLACGPDLLRLKLYPDAKELTESFAAFHAVRAHLGHSFSPSDPSVTAVCVGDGSVPRTAALFAYRTKWQCYSVDPQLREPSDRWGGIERLQAIRAKVEDCRFTADKLLIVCVHAHVGLAECLDVMDWKDLGIVAMPCCNFYSRLQLSGHDSASLVVEYYDTGIVSPHRLVRVYGK
mmetsp:Transcript_26609/g.51221  ORF Transcript_26609/g.51221 Transcript_26609/m.51221 type:complete len:366 (+) Transcript_26609:98-1195(+)